MAIMNSTEITLNDLKNEVNQWLGFHEDGTPRINYGPCGVFAKLFYESWNNRFNTKVHIVFILTHNLEECWHIAIRLSSGELYDGGVGIHTEDFYGKDYVFEDMLEYNEPLLEKWAYGLDRDYPRFCPNFNKQQLENIINKHLDSLLG